MRHGGRRRRRYAVLSGFFAVVLTLTGPLAGAAAASVGSAGGSAARGATSAATAAVARAEAAARAALPSLPKVALSVTDGQSAESLLANALLLSDLGIDDSALQSALATTQAALDRDGVSAAQDSLAAATASSRSRKALIVASEDLANVDSLTASLVSAAVFAYMGDSQSAAAVDPALISTSPYASVYADSVLSPGGLLSERRAVASDAATAASDAASEASLAEQEAAKAQAALSDEKAEQASLVSSLRAVDAGPAVAIESTDHSALASEAAQYLAAPASLQFTPKEPLPAQVATTSVALTWAFAELGKPYVWGATGPGSFDCSGLTQYVWAKAGVAIPRVAADQYAWTVPVPLSQLLPGDLVFYGLSDIHHVGIYIGDGLMINAPYTGTVVQVSSIWWYDLAGFGRVHDPGVPVPARLPPSVTKPAQPVVQASASKPVPSQTKAPAGWKPKPGESTPFAVYPVKPSASTTTTSSTSTTTSTTASTTPQSPTSSSTTRSTLLPHL